MQTKSDGGFSKPGLIVSFLSGNKLFGVIEFQNRFVNLHLNSCRKLAAHHSIFVMTKNIEIKPDDPIIQSLKFRPYRSAVERRVRPFSPRPDEPQTIDIRTPWGEVLTATPGDLLVSELDKPDDVWPVEVTIFDKTYIITRPGYCAKAALTDLVPMTDLTGGDPDAEVMVHTMEGDQTVRAGDFYLARGIKGEIWSYPKEKIGKTMIPAD